MDESSFQAYEDEIQALEEEIRLLTEQYEDIQQEESTFFSNEEILESMKSFQDETEGHESLSDLKAQLESLERELSFLTAVTGFHFTSHSKKTVEKTKNGTVKKHRLSGKCYSLSFQLEFQLLETPNSEKVSAVVSDLSIIMDSREDSNVSKFVSSTEERGDLPTFFRGISTYAKWHEHRRCTFLHFKAKYPDIVTLPEGLLGDFIILRSPKVSGFELMIVWKIHLDEEGTTTPVLDLLPKIPEQVVEQRMTTVESIPGCFRSLLRLFGIEAAIENLIQVLDSEK
ncbi:centromere protein P [Hirundo rustica]|uniref:centromere protein P n=1 Tax=Hirundo rustica TaxID=43150 RepID=UPI001A94A9F7|nr:centromere protein P [Hirundo rustica]XP_039932030.1 centromere protein P [Hirundo rustica]XP_039932031.1 centromere protein P [Hirundo rustica]XP_058278193.1 centromere protein P [Hirundo rustica]XP_058278194.1 centromere protein P [Hirundo rustica]